MAAVFAEHGTTLPDPEMARIIVAWDDLTVAGFVVIQMQPHIEPLYVAPAYRHQGLAGELAAAAVSIFAPGVPYYAFSPREGIAQLAINAGLEQLPWHVYRGMN